MNNNIYNLSSSDFSQGWKIETYQEYWSFLKDKDLSELEVLTSFCNSKSVEDSFR